MTVHPLAPAWTRQGDDLLDLDDEFLRVNVRRATLDAAFAGAIAQMRARSAQLVQSDVCDRLVGEHQRRREDQQRLALNVRLSVSPGMTPGAT